MPSGSHSGGHGGGGGSHFGGGGSSSGSHGGSGSSRNHGYRNGRSVVFFGRGYHRRYMYSGAHSAFSILIAIGIFALVIGSLVLLTMGGNNKDLKNIEADYLYYQDMIADAEEKLAQGDDSYFVDGIIISKFKNDNCDKWYVTYYFLDNQGKKVEGYTYSIYTWEQVKDMDNGDIIKLAVDTNPITQDTDSINLDYKNTTLNDDGEYIKIIKSKENTQRVGIIALVIGGLLVAGAIIIRIKASHKVLEDSQDFTEFSNSGRKLCKYCGGYLKSGDTICSDCGGRVK